MMNLTAENYHSAEADAAYYSASQIKAFVACPSAWLAKRRGLYRPVETEAMQVGTYIDLALLTPDELPGWVAAHHDEVHTKAGTKRAAYQAADEMIAAVQRHPSSEELLRGKRQAVLTATLAGHPIKCKLDVLNVATRRIVDLKTCADTLATEWDAATRRRLHWISSWDYWLQLAIYRAVARAAYGWPAESPEVHILAVDRHPRVPTVEWYRLDAGDGESELRAAGARALAALDAMAQLRDERELPRGEGWILDGQDRPLWCGSCDWCRRNNTVAAPLVWRAGDWKREAC